MSKLEQSYLALITSSRVYLIQRNIAYSLNVIKKGKRPTRSKESAIDTSDGLTYLDLIINQIETLNSKYGSRVPLLLVNKDDIHDSSLKDEGKTPYLYVEVDFKEVVVSVSKLEA
ncbi:hypothetical protein JHK84_043517 [Glycine max]|nr:hypothetical protein JHK84_043517 [Glycine max]